MPRTVGWNCSPSGPTTSAGSARGKRPMRENRVKRLLKAGKPAIGSIVSLPDMFVAEVMAGIGFDFLLIDTEHAPVTIGELQELLIALRGTESTILVRAAWNDMVMVKQILDVGAE